MNNNIHTIQGNTLKESNGFDGDSWQGDETHRVVLVELNQGYYVEDSSIATIGKQIYNYYNYAVGYLY